MRRFTDGRWPWLVALAFIVLTLAALVTIPLLVQRSVARHRGRIEAAEPARTLLMRLQFSIVRESATLRDYLQTGDSTYIKMYHTARAAEQETLVRLAPLARSMGSAVFERFVEVRTLTSEWHSHLRERTEASQLLEQVLQGTARLDSAIIATTAHTRGHIAAAERAGLKLTLLSGALAILASLVVGFLVLRVQRLAAESERRRLETVEALAQSARAAEARNRLLRGVTHDLKNPLGAAQGYAELLEMGVKGELTPEQRAMVKGLERSLDSALAIISDLLDLARSDSGGITVHRVNVDLNEIVRDAVEVHRGAAETSGHVIRFAGAERPLRIYTDPARVRQVLDNLLSNAIKYTPAPGQIVVRTEPDARDAPRISRSVAVRVSDTGPGIPPEQREHIFDEFTRLHDDGELKGHGLGLAIARRIARLLGGDLGVSDSNGRGATFVLWLPQRDATKN